MSELPELQRIELLRRRLRAKDFSPEVLTRPKKMNTMHLIAAYVYSTRATGQFCQ